MSKLPNNVADLWLEVMFSTSLKCYNDDEVDDNGDVIGIVLVEWWWWYRWWWWHSWWQWYRYW